MRKASFMLTALSISLTAHTQNVGIGTLLPQQKLHVEGITYLNGYVGIVNATPNYPLSFNGSLGDKISLWNDGTSTHYGFGIQSGILQVFTKSSGDNIAFGYGSSGFFSERVRIKNSGDNAMEITGRVVLSNGSSPLASGSSAGIWFKTPDNSSQLAFIGTRDFQNIGFYGGPAGWGLTYDAINSRVGIGNTTPTSPLSFALSLGKKISFYPGITGDAGIAMAPNRLQIFSDNPNADVAFGYDAAGTFVEKFAMKPNGALALNGNTGNKLDLAVASGSGGATTWQPLGAILQSQYKYTGNNVVTWEVYNNSAAEVKIPSLSGLVFTVDVLTRFVVCAAVYITTDCPGVGSCTNNVDFYYKVNGSPSIPVIQTGEASFTGMLSNHFYDVNPGTYTIDFYTRKNSASPLNFHSSGGYATIMALPK